MSRFIQMHLLVPFPTPLPERVRLAREPHAPGVGALRHRRPFRWLQHAVRFSIPLRWGLAGHVGLRTACFGDRVRAHLLEHGAPERRALDIASDIAALFGEVDRSALDSTPPRVRTRRLAFLSPVEQRAALAWAERLLAGEPRPRDLAERVLRSADDAADLALFGRTGTPHRAFDRPAALLLHHAVTSHAVERIEHDYFDAVDELNRPQRDRGAERIEDAPPPDSHVYYVNACVDTGRLVRNLGGDRPLARRTVEALVTALAAALPGGRDAMVRAHYVRAEASEGAPVNLSGAFLAPVCGQDRLRASIAAFEHRVRSVERLYGPLSHAHVLLDVPGGQGSLPAIRTFCAAQVGEG